MWVAYNCDWNSVDQYSTGCRMTTCIHSEREAASVKFRAGARPIDKGGGSKLQAKAQRDERVIQGG